MKNLKLATKKGFSLVELLVVIAVIGVIAAIAIPAMTNVFENSKQAKAKRNAQTIVSTYAAARAAGYAGAANEADAITAICGNGVTGTGNFATTTFRNALDGAEQTLADAYIGWDNTNSAAMLTYTGTAGN